LLAPFDLLASLGMDIYVPVVPEMAAQLGTNAATVQLTLSVYLLLLGLSQLVFGPLADRIGRRKVILGGGAMFIAASVALAFARSGTAFVVLRGMEAAGGGATLVATFATVRDVYATRPEGVVIYGILGSMLGLVPALGPLLGAWVDHVMGWRGIFGLLAALALAAEIQVWLRWPETKPASSPPAGVSSVRAILACRPFWAYTGAYSAALGCFFVYFSTSSLVLITKLGLGQTVFSLIFGTVAVVMIATSRFTGRFVLRWGERGCVTRGMALLLLGAVLLVMGQAVFHGPSIVGFVGPMWVIAVGISLTCAVTANGALRPFGQSAGTATALYHCLESLIVTITGTVAVVTLPADTIWPLACFAGTSALLMLCVIMRLRT
jgi:DHA1 family florfenicol/chloramphenicol resistance protein-like MFS transporter